MQDEDFTIERDGREEDGMSEVDLEAQESRAESKVGKARQELEAAREEAKQNLDGWQRAKADYVNALKRFEEEKGRAVEQGLLKAVKALLPAYDALERARAHGEIPDGFEGIAKQLEGAFAALGVTPLGVEGEPFDPMRHEALGNDMTEDQAMDDRVTQVLEKGYAVGTSILRPARVRVAHFES
jgi:molecular chaperone GrpE